jgi:hypothetical protein
VITEDQRRKIETHKRDVLTVSKRSAVVRQLETAIKLWFTEGDPVAIHTLAVAANDCLHAMGKAMDKPSAIRSWINSQSKAFQDRAHEAQNFFKHGSKKLAGRIRYSPLFGDVLITDSVICYRNLFDNATPLMRLFAARFALENVEIVTGDLQPFFLKRVEVYKLAEISRREFFDRVLPSFLKIAQRSR